MKGREEKNTTTAVRVAVSTPLVAREAQNETEWGIVHHLSPDVLHRGPMTEDEARTWVREWIEDGGNPRSFVVVRRAVYSTPWEAVDA